MQARVCDMICQAGFPVLQTAGFGRFEISMKNPGNCAAASLALFYFCQRIIECRCIQSSEETARCALHYRENAR
jgi:hypothetical protein